MLLALNQASLIIVTHALFLLVQTTYKSATQPLSTAHLQEFVLRNWRIVKVATTKAKRKLFLIYVKLKKG